MSKWQIWEYTLPQITELMKQANKYIEFQVELTMQPIKAMGASMGVEFKDKNKDETSTNTDVSDDGYADLTEDDIPLLMQALGG